MQVPRVAKKIRTERTRSAVRARALQLGIQQLARGPNVSPTSSPCRSESQHSLTVLAVAYPLAPVGDDAVGGAEQILTAIDHALVTAGHRSLVIACAGSHVAGELIALPAVDEPVCEQSWYAAHEACRTAIRNTLARERVDLVHMHGIDFHAYLPEPGPVVLATLHLPIDWYPPSALACSRPGTFLQCVSRTQQASAPSNPCMLSAIENGVDLERLYPERETGDYALVLGRICPEKGQHLALDAATRANVPLVIAGKAFGFAEHQAYFHTQIEPRLIAPHRFVGVVAGEAKRQLIARARCVVVPSLVDETSSLVAMEALACGTPVIAFRRGALIELIEHGRTGFLVDDVDELAHGLAEAHRIDRARCRAVAEARCSRRHMCERYLARYRELVTPLREARVRRPSLRVDVIDRAGLESIAPAWAELWQRDDHSTAFQRVEWCAAWCRHLLAGDVEALAAWRGDTLEAFLPLFRWHDGDAEVLSLLGGGVSDYLDVLVAPGADDAARALEHALATRTWQRVELSELRDGSPLLSFTLPGRDVRSLQEPCPGLAIDPGAPLAGLSPRLVHEIEYQRRRAARELGIEHVTLGAAELIDALATLHRARWSLRGEHGVIDDRRRAFLADAAAGLARRDGLLGTGVRLGGELAAVVFGFVDRDHARYYLGGFDPRHERRSPGTLAIAAAIEEAGRRGARLFDFLRGAEPYKYRFGARDQVHLHRRVVLRSAL